MALAKRSRSRGRSGGRSKSRDSGRSRNRVRDSSRRRKETGARIGTVAAAEVADADRGGSVGGGIASWNVL